MSEQAIQELKELLAAEDHEVAFLEYMPAPAVKTLLASIRNTIENESETLTKAVATGTSALPAPIAPLARGILR